MFPMTQPSVSKYYPTSFAPPRRAPLQLFRDPGGLGLGTFGPRHAGNRTLPLPHTLHPNGGGREWRKRTTGAPARRTPSAQAPSESLAPGRGSFLDLERGARELGARAGRLTGRARARPPHLHLCRPTGLTAAPTQIQAPGGPCWRGSTAPAPNSGPRPRRGRGLRGAGAAGLRPPRRLSPRSGPRPPDEAVPPRFSAAVVEFWKKKTVTQQREKQLEPSAPALREPRGEAAYPTSSPQPRPRFFPSPLVLSQDPGHTPGTLGPTGSPGSPSASAWKPRSSTSRPAPDLSPPSDRPPRPRLVQGLTRPFTALVWFGTSSPVPSKKKTSKDWAASNRLAPHLDPYHGSRPYLAVTILSDNQARSLSVVCILSGPTPAWELYLIEPLYSKTGNEDLVRAKPESTRILKLWRRIAKSWPCPPHPRPFQSVWCFEERLRVKLLHSTN